MTSVEGEGQPRAEDSALAKDALRARLRLARASRRTDRDAASRLTDRALNASTGAVVVAAYASRPDEPDTLALIEALRRDGVRVLLPVLRREPDWAWYDGHLVPGPLGIGRPTGARLGAGSLELADVIWVPGLAGTTAGDRLGTGGGWYDRALAWARPDARRGLLLYDEEVLPQLPTDPWDQRVQFLVTPERLLRCRAE